MKIAPFIIVKYAFDPPISDEAFDEVFDKTNRCLDLALDRKRRICVFEAKDAEAVRQAYRMAGTKFERVWSAEQISNDEESEDAEAGG